MSRTKESDLSLEALIKDITDEARLKSKKPSRGGSSALYGNSGNKASGNNKKPSKGNRDKKPKCLRCKDLNLSHPLKKCFTTNKELRKAFKKRTKKTYVPYYKRENNNNNSGNSKPTNKKKDDDKDRGSFTFVINLNPNFYTNSYRPAFLVF